MRHGLTGSGSMWVAIGLGLSLVARADVTATVVHSFAPGEARYPSLEGTLAAGPGHMIYGVSQLGGRADQGTVYSINERTGKFRQLHSFVPPPGGTLLATAVGVSERGGIYVTTYQGGREDYGAIYLVSPLGGAVRIHSFDGINGARPSGPLVTRGRYIYGTGILGEVGHGSAFRFDAFGNVEVLHNFPNTLSPDETLPYGLSAGAQDTFYGTTNGWVSPPESHGAVYSLRTDGDYRVLHYFTGADGDRPYFAPVLAPDGNIYGTTPFGGEHDCGVIYRIAPDATFTVVHAFDCDTDSGYPWAGLVLASDGHLYGVTEPGALYRVSTDGTFEILYRAQESDGPTGMRSPLLETEPGVFYGVSGNGGRYGRGTVYRIELGCLSCSP